MAFEDLRNVYDFLCDPDDDAVYDGEVDSDDEISATDRDEILGTIIALARTGGESKVSTMREVLEHIANSEHQNTVFHFELMPLCLQAVESIKRAYLVTRSAYVGDLLDKLAHYSRFGDYGESKFDEFLRNYGDNAIIK